MKDDSCVCCGVYIPEGSMVCNQCLKENDVIPIVEPYEENLEEQR